MTSESSEVDCRIPSMALLMTNICLISHHARQICVCFSRRPSDDNNSSAQVSFVVQEPSISVPKVQTFAFNKHS